MQPDLAQKLTSNIQDFFSDEQTKLHLSLRQGLSVQDYQVQDMTRQALLIALGILETFKGEFDKYCTIEAVKQCLKLIQDRYDENWKDLPKNEYLQRFMAGVGFLAADMGVPGEAESLFHILALLDPDNVHPLLGLAYTKLVAGSAQEALEVIRDKVLNIAPGNDLGLAFLALAYDELNMTEEALAAASAVIAANRDDSAVILAREVQRSLCQPAVAENIAE